jgi:DNA-binding transcriptional LysR family regulator
MDHLRAPDVFGLGPVVAAAKDVCAHCPSGHRCADLDHLAGEHGSGHRVLGAEEAHHQPAVHRGDAGKVRGPQPPVALGDWACEDLYQHVVVANLGLGDFSGGEHVGGAVCVVMGGFHVGVSECGRTVKFDWNRARAFLVTAEEGSFSAAARALGMAQPTVGRQVAALEGELGVTLFERVGRSLVLTTAGLDMVEHVRSMGQAATRLSLAAAGQSLSLNGTVAITSSDIIAAQLLPPIIGRIRSAHPGIHLDLVASIHISDLQRREADIAVRGFRPIEPELFARKIRDDGARLYASPAYLDRIGNPSTLADLADAEIFGFERSDSLQKRLAAFGLQLTPANFPVVTDNHLVQWEMAK